MIRRVLLWGALGIGAAVLAIALLAVALSYGWQRDRLRAALETRLAEAVGEPVSIASLDGVLHRGVSAQNVRLGNADRPLLAVEALRVRWGGLRWGETPTLVIANVDLEGVRADLRRDANGSWPWERAADTEEGGAAASALGIELGAVTLLRGAIVVADPVDHPLYVEAEARIESLQLAPAVSVGSASLSLGATRQPKEASLWTRASLSASGSPDRWTLDTFEIDGPSVSLRAQGAGSREGFSASTFQAEIGSVAALTRLLTGQDTATPPPVSGKVAMRAEFSGPYTWPLGNVSLEATEIAAGDLALGGFRLEGTSSTAGALRIEALELRSDTIELRAEPGARFETRGGEPSLKGMRLRGSGGNGLLIVEAKAALGFFQAEDWQRHPGTEVKLRVEDWPLELLQPVWRPLGAEVAGRVEGSLSLVGARDGPRVAGALRSAAVRAAAESTAVEGLSFDLEIDGSIASPGLALTAQAENLVWNERALGAPRLELRSSDGETLEADMRLRGSGGNGLLIGEAKAALGFFRAEDWQRHPGTEVKLRVEDWPLELLQPLWPSLGAEVAGRVEGSLSLVGARDGPRVAGALRSAAVRAANESTAVEGLSFDLEIDGSIASPSLALTAQAENLVWNERALGAPRLELRSSDGETLEVGAFELQGGALPVRIQPGARLRRVDEGISLENFGIESGSQQIGVSGWISATAARGLAVELGSLDLVAMRETAAALGASTGAMEASGSLRGDLRIDGSFEGPRIDGKLTVENARFSEFDFERVALALRTPADAQLALLHAESRWTQGGRDVLEVDAELPTRLFRTPASLLEDPATSVRVVAHGFELGALNPWLPPDQAQIGGSLEAQVDLRGRPGQPALSGSIAIREGLAELTGFGGTRLAPVTAELRFDDRELVVQQLRVGEQGAGFAADGRLGIVSGAPDALALGVVFDSFPLAVPGLVEGRLDGAVEIGGSVAAPVVRGTLTLDGLHIQIPEPDAPEFKEIRVLGAGSDETELQENADISLLDPVELDLQVEIERDSWARGRGADVELRGDFRALKDPGGPIRYSGGLETVRGRYELYARRFRIERGKVTLDGAVEVDPILDIRAEHRVRKVRIFVVIEGRLSEPRLRFESRPELSETDIASYLLLGRPSQASDGRNQPALEAAAAQIAAGAALREFEQLFGGQLPVDMIDVRVGGEDDASEVSAGVGKYIGDRLFLYYERGFGDEPTDELKAEFELTPRWSVESTVSSDGASGADLIFEIGE